MKLVKLPAFTAYIVSYLQIFVTSAARICIFLHFRMILCIVYVVICDISEDFHMSSVTTGFKPSDPHECNLICVT